MKTLILLCSTFITITNSSLAQWQAVGIAGISAGYAWDISIETDCNGTPYVCYNDGANGSKPTVQKFNGSSWEIVGTAGFTSSFVLSPVLQLDQYGTPYIAFSDGAAGQHLSVMKYDGSNWAFVGAQGLTAELTSYCDFSLTTDGTPYVAFPDYSKQNKISVMKFNGTNWVSVGAPGFSQYDVSFPNIEIASDGTPYVTYLESSFTTLTTKKFDGNNWILVGSAGFVNEASLPKLKLDKSDVPYVAYTTFNKLKVTKFTNQGGTGWEQVGNDVFDNTPYSFDLTIDEQNIPIIGYTQYWSNWKAVVKKLESSTWETVGGLYANEDSTDWLNITNDKFGNLYIAYKDVELNDKASIRKFGDFNSVPSTTASNNQFEIFPNPAKDFITIHEANNFIGDCLLTVFSIEGKKIANYKYPLPAPINIKELSAGTYLITIENAALKQVYHAKFVKE